MKDYQTSLNHYRGILAVGAGEESMLKAITADMNGKKNPLPRKQNRQMPQGLARRAGIRRWITVAAVA